MKDMVTELREEKKGYRVTVNDTETFRLSFADYRAMPLAEGQALDWEQYKHDLLLLQYPAALDQAVRLLAVRPRSHVEVERRLAERGYLADAAEMAVYKLEKGKAAGRRSLRKRLGAGKGCQTAGQGAHFTGAASKGRGRPNRRICRSHA